MGPLAWRAPPDGIHEYNKHLFNESSPALLISPYLNKNKHQSASGRRNLAGPMVIQGNANTKKRGRCHQRIRNAHPWLKANSVTVRYPEKDYQQNLKHPLPPATYLSQWDNEATQVLLLAGEADIVRRHKHLPQNVHFVERSPEGAVCVAI